MSPDFTPVAAAIGGALIGAAASVLLLFHGRIAGISGILGDSVDAVLRGAPSKGDASFRVMFLAGLALSGLLLRVVSPAAFDASAPASWPAMAVAGVLVGYGTRVGGGCTSGHGVCGLSRLSARSLVATLTFMATAALTVFVVRHVAKVLP